MNTPRAITGLLVVFVLGIIVLNAVQAQNTPTNTTSSTSTGVSDYKRLINNLPVIDQMIGDNVPVFKQGENIRPALEYLANYKQKGFAAIRNPLSGNGLYVLISETASGNEGEILVYRYYREENQFALMDCDWGASSETDNINDDDEILNELGDPISIDEFLAYYDCGLGWIDQTFTGDDLAYGEEDDEAVGIGGSIREVLRSSANAITSAYGGTSPFVVKATYSEESLPNVTTGESTPGKTTTASAAESTVTSCVFGDNVKEYTLDASGRVNMTNGNPQTTSGNNSFDLVSGDNRLSSPASILIKDNKGVSKYLLNITDFTLEDDRVSLQMTLCTNEKGWKNYWDKVTYAIWTDNDTREVKSRNASSASTFKADFVNYENNAEIRADFMSTLRNTVSVFVYIDEDEKSIYNIAVDSVRESNNNTILRFNLNPASLQAIREALMPSEYTPDEIREMITIQMKGSKNATGSTPTAELILGEGVLNTEGSANASTFDNKYWKVSSNLVTPAEYTFTFTIDGYRPIERKVVITSKLLSPTDPNKLTFENVYDAFNIRDEDLKKDHCSACNDLLSCTLCADTMFVDKLTN